MKNTRVQTWAILLDEYGCEIQYKTGKSNVHADMLSRLPGTNCESTEVSMEVGVLDTNTHPQVQRCGRTCFKVYAMQFKKIEKEKDRTARHASARSSIPNYWN